MFEILPASATGADSSAAHAAASFGTHLLLIGAAIALTRPEPGRPSPPVVSSPAVYQFIQTAPPRPPDVQAPPSGIPAPSPFTALALPPALPLPTGLGPPDAAPFPGAAGPPEGPEGAWLIAAPAGADGGTVWPAAAVDEPVRVIEPGRLRYPPVLERAGVGGSVVVEFIVDSIGGLEQGSEQVVSATAHEFEEAALEAVRASRFLPARARGTPVRQRVRQRFTFEAPRR